MLWYVKIAYDDIRDDAYPEGFVVAGDKMLMIEKRRKERKKANENHLERRQQRDQKSKPREWRETPTIIEKPNETKETKRRRKRACI